MNESGLRNQALLGCVVALAAAAVYANALRNGFALDDVFIIQNNPRVRDLSNLREILLTPYWPWSGRELGLYRPVTILLYAVQWALGDGAAWVFHLVNIALHAAASVLVFLLVARLTAPVAAAAAALVFAVHPVHTEAVANIVGQAELVSAVAMLAVCVLHVSRPGLEVSWPRRLIYIALFLVGLGTKESAVVLPALLIALDLAQRRVAPGLRGAARYADAMLMPVFLFAAALAGYLLLRIDVMSGSVIGVDAAPAMPYLREEYRVLNALRAFPEFIRLLIFPQELAADYLPAVIMPVEEVRPMVVLGALLLAGFALLALLTPWLPAAGLPAAWFLITIITVSNLFFPIGVLVAERTLYLPSVALALAIAFSWIAAARSISPSRRTFALTAVAAVILLFAARTWVRNPDWADTLAVYRAMVRDHPHSYRAQWVQAMALRGNRHTSLADQHFRMAYRIYPRDSQLMTDYGEFLLEHGRYTDAVDMLERSYAIHPNAPNTLAALAQAYLATGRGDDALRIVAEAERLDLPRSITMPLRAFAYEALGKDASAIGAARVASRNARATTRMWLYLARILARGGHHAEAVAAIEAARLMAADSTARTLADQFEHAVRADCFAGGRAQTPTADPSCDPLGPGFRFTAPPHIANDLQSAMPPSPPTPGPGLPQSR